MNARRMVEHREMFMGEELVWYTMASDPLPAPSDLATSVLDSERIITPSATVQVLPARTEGHRTVKPTREQYARAFDAMGSRPKCVRDRVNALMAVVRAITRDFDVTNRMPRRVRKAIRPFRPENLAVFYDKGAFARLEHYVVDHAARLDVRRFRWAQGKVRRIFGRPVAAM
jgi:hypothetical protein